MKILKTIAIGLLLFTNIFLLLVLFVEPIRSQVQSISGLAVAQSTIQWNHLKDAVVGDDLTNGLAAVVPYGFDGTNFDRQRIASGGASIISTAASSTFTTGQVTVDATADLIRAANTSRKSIIIVNHSTTVDVFIGSGAGVLATTGILLKAGNALTLDRNTGAVYGITAAGSITAGFLEE